MLKDKLLTFMAAFLVISALIFAFAENSEAGGIMPPINPGCCQAMNSDTGAYVCENTNNECGAAAFPIVIIGFFEGENCNEQSGLCSGFVPDPDPVPTLTEWGLIAMAGVLGLVGFMVIRRRKASA